MKISMEKCAANTSDEIIVPKIEKLEITSRLCHDNEFTKKHTEPMEETTATFLTAPIAPKSSNTQTNTDRSELFDSIETTVDQSLKQLPSIVPASVPPLSAVRKLYSSRGVPNELLSNVPVGSSSTDSSEEPVLRFTALPPPLPPPTEHLVSKENSARCRRFRPVT